jgi:hypothetical protein
MVGLLKSAFDNNPADFQARKNSNRASFHVHCIRRISTHDHDHQPFVGSGA